MPAIAPTIFPEEELALEPVELPPVSGVQHVLTSSEPEIGLAPAPVARPPLFVRSDVARGSVSEEKPREDVITPPRRAGLQWAFTNNVLGFPFQRYALAQWICASVALIVGDEAALLSMMGFMSHSMAGALQTGCFGIAAFFAVLFSLSYLAACFMDITVNAAYNIDKAHEWPDPNWRERVLVLVRLMWVGTIVVLLTSAMAGVSSFFVDIFLPTCLVLTFLLFPIVLLGALEADSFFWPVSGPVFRSLRTAWQAWILFYFLTAILWGANEVITRVLFDASPFLMPLVAGPLFAAAVFIYGRLLGRLAWFILRKTDTDQDHKATQRSLEQRRWEM
jgi:hypothetical protein